MGEAQIEFWIGGPPVAKGRPRVYRIKGITRTVTPPNTLKYESEVRVASQIAMGGRDPLEGPVAVSIDIRMPWPKSAPKWLSGKKGVWHTRKPDLDNIVKSVLDGMGGVVFAFDSQVVRLLAMKTHAPRPGVQVVVSGGIGLHSNSKKVGQ
jgi:Holliday junction resolvase RusA-like endonuclease